MPHAYMASVMKYHVNAIKYNGIFTLVADWQLNSISIAHAYKAHNCHNICENIICSCIYKLFHLIVKVVR